MVVSYIHTGREWFPIRREQARQDGARACGGEEAQNGNPHRIRRRRPRPSHHPGGGLRPKEATLFRRRAQATAHHQEKKEGTITLVQIDHSSNTQTQQLYVRCQINATIYYS